MQSLKLLLTLWVALLVGCTQVHSEADARERATKAFQEFMLKKNIDKSQFKEPRVTYNSAIGAWEAYYEWIGPAEAENSVNILVDKFGRVELHAENP